MVKATILPENKSAPLIERKNFRLCDKKAENCAQKLADVLYSIQNSNAILYGHQNEMHMKAGPVTAGFTESDCADVTGEYAAVHGLDVLSLTGVELGKWDWPEETRIDAACKLVEKSVAAGGIITLSAHMPNFCLLHQRATGTEPESDKKHGSSGAHAYEGLPHKLIDGSINLSGYTPNDLRGNVVIDVMPGHKLNGLYLEYLDLVCKFLKKLSEKNIAVIWRPFHENTGGWFWWGVRSCTADEFRALWKYTWEYMNTEKKVHNLIWAYSPGSENKDEKEIMSRYPGDQYVDLVGFDMYENYEWNKDTFWNDFEKQCAMYSSFCQKHEKLFANTETGIMRPDNKALLLEGNDEADWYNKIADICCRYNSAYFLLWANFCAEGAYYTPYCESRVVEKGKIKEITGHELLDSFINFYNRQDVIFSSTLTQLINNESFK